MSNKKYVIAGAVVLGLAGRKIIKDKRFIPDYLSVIHEIGYISVEDMLDMYNRYVERERPKGKTPKNMVYFVNEQYKLMKHNIMKRRTNYEETTKKWAKAYDTMDTLEKNAENARQLRRTGTLSRGTLHAKDDLGYPPESVYINTRHLTLPYEAAEAEAAQAVLSAAQAEAEAARVIQQRAEKQHPPPKPDSDVTMVKHVDNILMNNTEKENGILNSYLKEMKVWAQAWDKLQLDLNNIGHRDDVRYAAAKVRPFYDAKHAKDDYGD